MSSRTISLLLAGSAGLVACETVRFSAGEPASDGSYDSTWGYLEMKYDRDGDGVIVPAEYDRKGGNFERLDRDGDGVVTPSDFEGGEDMGQTITDMEARRMVVEYFQDGDDPEQLAVYELMAAAEAYDTDGDWVVEEGEFRAQADERRQAPPDDDMRRFTAGLDPWAGLVNGLDADGDGALAFAEFESFFKDRDDGDDVWYLDASGQPMDASAERGEPVSGPRVGTMAPDFTLAPPEGGEPVTLSDFRGDRPVALIFGSYT